jgi:hypothetical protein
MKRICVNCGSNSGDSPEYLDAAAKLGEYLASRDIELVYGGASVGLMGALADAALRNGGIVTGVITGYLNEKVGHRGLTKLIVVDTMHERKEEMFNLADAFIVLPGGYGTLEEMFEVLTWGQLGHHGKPCGLLNIMHYFDGLLAFLDHGVEKQFIKHEHRNMIIVSREPRDLVDRFVEYRAPETGKWIIT